MAGRHHRPLFRFCLWITCGYVDNLCISCGQAVDNLCVSCGQPVDKRFDRGGGVVLACKSYGCLPPTEKAKLKYNLQNFPRG
jgi:predicted amidophosphoribosyltransferase